MSPPWTCSACGMTVRYAPGATVPVELPNGWSRNGGALRCLACRRQAVSDAATAAHAEASESERRRAARAALTRFELERDPNRRDGEIGRLIGVTGAVVSEVRRKLIAAGEISGRRSARSGVFRSKNPGAGLRAEAELRRNPGRSNAEIARSLGIGAQTVARARKRICAEQEGM